MIAHLHALHRRSKKYGSAFRLEDVLVHSEEDGGELRVLVNDLQPSPTHIENKNI